MLFIWGEDGYLVDLSQTDVLRANGIVRGPIWHASMICLARNCGLAVSQSIVSELKSAKTGTVAGEAEPQTAAGTDQSRRQVHEFLDDGFQTASFGAMAHGADIAGEADESNPSQDIVAERRQRHD